MDQGTVVGVAIVVVDEAPQALQTSQCLVGLVECGLELVAVSCDDRVVHCRDGHIVVGQQVLVCQQQGQRLQEEKVKQENIEHRNQDNLGADSIHLVRRLFQSHYAHSFVCGLFVGVQVKFMAAQSTAMDIVAFFRRFGLF